MVPPGRSESLPVGMRMPEKLNHTGSSMSCLMLLDAKTVSFPGMPMLLDTPSRPFLAEFFSHIAVLCPLQRHFARSYPKAQHVALSVAWCTHTCANTYSAQQLMVTCAAMILCSADTHLCHCAANTSKGVSQQSVVAYVHAADMVHS
jgi:hypothetical protein